jgi:hypothetical protein
VEEDLCDDNINCTYELPCDPNAGGQPESGCVRIPLDIRCEDSDPCTIDYCDPSSGCVHEEMDCDDGIHCTVDTCVNGNCTHTPNNTICADAFSCTEDVCSVTLGRCTNIRNDSVCNPGSDKCKIYTCNPPLGDSTGCYAAENKVIYAVSSMEVTSQSTRRWELTH